MPVTELTPCATVRKRTLMLCYRAFVQERLLSSAERVWRRLQSVAADTSSGNFRGGDEARIIVDRIIHEERLDFTPPEAREYFVREFERMVSGGTSQGTALKSPL